MSIERNKLKEIVDDSIVQKWMAYIHLNDSNKFSLEWQAEKHDFWIENKEYLSSKGFKYYSDISSAMDQIEIMKKDNLEGSLLVVKIGSEQYPASYSDLDNATKLIKDVLGDVRGVKAIVVPHSFEISSIDLPQLRELQSEVLSSTNIEKDINPIIEHMDLE